MKELTPEECLKIGGHCYEMLSRSICTSILLQACKHCGHRQEGTEQESIRWEDVKKDGGEIR